MATKAPLISTEHFLILNSGTMRKAQFIYRGVLFDALYVRGDSLGHIIKDIIAIDPQTGLWFSMVAEELHVRLR